jgi:hypothetical protein
MTDTGAQARVAANAGELEHRAGPRSRRPGPLQQRLHDRPLHRRRARTAFAAAVGWFGWTTTAVLAAASILAAIALTLTRRPNRHIAPLIDRTVIYYFEVPHRP